MICLLCATSIFWGVMNNSFLFLFRCSLTQRWILVNLNHPSSSNSSSQQVVLPRLFLVLPGEGLGCCICRAVGTSAPSVAQHLSLWTSKEMVENWCRGQALEQVQGQGQGHGPVWIILTAHTVWSESLERQCFEGKPMLLMCCGWQHTAGCCLTGC